MRVFFYGIIVGICKVIPGVSGGIVAVFLGIYNKIIMIFGNFFKCNKDDIWFLLRVIIGILIGIILSSKFIMYLLNKYYYVVMIGFVLIIILEMVKDYLNNNFDMNDILMGMVFSLIGLILIKLFNGYTTKFILNEDIKYFLGGVIETISSIIPGISGTSFLMMIGIYDEVMMIISEIWKISYVVNNFRKYLLFFIGIISSFIINIKIINYFLIYKEKMFKKIIFSFEMFSVLVMIKNILILWN